MSVIWEQQRYSTVSTVVITETEEFFVVVDDHLVTVYGADGSLRTSWCWSPEASFWIVNLTLEKNNEVFVWAVDCAYMCLLKVYRTDGTFLRKCVLEDRFYAPFDTAPKPLIASTDSQVFIFDHR